MNEDGTISIEEKLYFNDEGDLVVNVGRVPFLKYISDLYEPRLAHQDLCHALSWSTIDNVFAYLFKISNHCTAATKKNILLQLSRALHDGEIICEDCNVSLASYYGNEIYLKSDNLINTITDTTTLNNLQDLYNWMNSQPYNLRLGNDSWNRKLKQHFDPREWHHFDAYGVEDRNNTFYFPGPIPNPATGMVNSYRYSASDERQRTDYQGIIRVLPNFPQDGSIPAVSTLTIYYTDAWAQRQQNKAETVWSSSNLYFC
ncbi:hypothetical protein [Leuconostoc falkenbergense]|uniref:hypothetical protein n=1 Tax=Leuconostoc falkenbergense TaxID=2766470 RepID=UPI0024A9B758|nr:hypothetical protein [Leuconostoc falkenbergense]MDI6553504.1 hypothetical protein [Leuconostoc falkenbergense]